MNGTDGCPFRTGSTWWTSGAPAGRDLAVTDGDHGPSEPVGHLHAIAPRLIVIGPMDSANSVTGEAVTGRSGSRGAPGCARGPGGWGGPTDLAGRGDDSDGGGVGGGDAGAADVGPPLPPVSRPS